ncbi:simple sugar transport system permease protein [Keratinibaculum paraultunense]|uniref:Simple sugar transport system permease protein n=1 Tax=Keratinibaculum paraultunense TaxID=1278232 RepID=A0A4R3KZF1_9FIRM|nr:ABC transporter permease [Keratinibaculum paraultunense]QQY80272.1 ABC transporter permease [Keratinibaculum paraultunense]TCS90787.1 simple sugar transport system permease protein [Keratinibaculum paraultunense]
MKRNRFIMIGISILLGLIVGAIVLLIAGFNPLEAYGVMIKGVFGSPKYISWTIIRSTPLILTGISVAFAFRTGLFNIGAEGQFIIGSLVATLVGYFVKLPPIIHPIVALLAGALAGALWAGFAGLLKAKFGINEVITTIMLNWIALYFSNFMVFTKAFKRPNKDASHRILESASINVLGKWKTSEAGKAFLVEHKFWKEFLNPPVNYGFIIAILVAMLIWYILKHTTLGYQLRAVGFNKDAAEYGGIDVKKNIVVSMMIAGALSGLAGATQVLGVSKETAILAIMEGYGFDGIAVSLISGNNPIGCIPAALLFGALKYGGSKLQPAIGAPFEVINIIIGIIVFFIAMPKLVEMIISYREKKRGGEVESIK